MMMIKYSMLFLFISCFAKKPRLPDGQGTKEACRQAGRSKTYTSARSVKWLEIIQK
jgi:hypothetical protein